MIQFKGASNVVSIKNEYLRPEEGAFPWLDNEKKHRDMLVDMQQYSPITVRIDGDMKHPKWNGHCGMALGPSYLEGSSRVKFEGQPFIYSIRDEYIHPESRYLFFHITPVHGCTLDHIRRPLQNRTSPSSAVS